MGSGACPKTQEREQRLLKALDLVIFFCHKEMRCIVGMERVRRLYAFSSL